MRRRVGFVVLAIALLGLLAWLALRDVTPTGPATLPAAEQGAGAAVEAPPQKVRVPEAAPTAPDPGNEEPLAEGPLARGIVVDSDGAPVAGARIVSHPDDLRSPVGFDGAGDEGSRTFVRTSAEDGTFEVPLDREGVRLGLIATADEGFGQVSVLPDDDRVRIELIPWMSITGRVTDTDKLPVPGATITLHVLLDSLNRDHVVLTDANGEYRIDRLPPLGFTGAGSVVGRGRHGWLLARADGYAPLLLDRVHLNPRNGSSVRMDLVLVRGCTLSGKVIAGDTREPIAGATVVCWSAEGSQVYVGSSGVGMSSPWAQRPLGETRSGDDGSFRFEHLPAQGPHRVASSNISRSGAMTMGHVAAWKDGYVYGGDAVPVSADGAALATTIELWPSAVVEGRVVDAAGGPVPDAWIAVYVDSRRPELNGFPLSYDESRATRVTTDAEGRYRLRTFRCSRQDPTSGKLVAGIAVGGRSIASDPVTVTAAAGETLSAPDLVVDVGGVPRATLVVVGGAGRPVAGAHLEGGHIARRAGLDGRIDWALGRRPPARGEPVPAQRVIVRGAGFAPQSVEFTPTFGAPVEVRVVLHPGARLAGRVTRADGAAGKGAWIVVADGRLPVSDAVKPGPSVMASVGDQGRLVIYGMGTAGADGSFEIVDLPDGPYHVAAEVFSRAPGGPGRLPKVLREVRSDVATGTSDLVLTIPTDDAPATQQLDVIVTDSAGDSVGQSVVRAVFEGTHLYARRIDSTRMRFNRVPVGTGRIMVSAPGYVAVALEDVMIDVNVAPEPLSVTLDKGTSLRGRVLAAEGDLPSGAKVVVSPIGGAAFPGAQSASISTDGGYEITGLGPATYAVHVSTTMHHARATELTPVGVGTVTIAEGQPAATADFIVRPGGRVQITAPDPRLPPHPFAPAGAKSTAEERRFGAGSRIEVVDASGRIRAARTPVHRDMPDAFVLAPGEYVVRFHLPDEPVREQRVTVTAGETTRVRLEDE